MRWPLAVAALAAGAAPGCIVWSDFSGLTGGGPASVIDGGAVDASDGEVDADAGAPTAPETGAEAAAPFSCEGALICDRFESGALAPPWTRTYQSPGATLGLTPLDAGAPPGNGLMAAVTATGETTYAYLARDFLPGPSSVTSARLVLSVLPERVDRTGLACIAGFVIGEGTGSDHVLRVLVDGEKTMLEERANGSGRVLTIPGGLPLGRWSRLGLSVSGDRVRAEIDGVTALDSPAYAQWASSDALRVVVGINFAGGDSVDGFTFRFDDVRFDAP